MQTVGGDDRLRPSKLFRVNRLSRMPNEVLYKYLSPSGVARKCEFGRKYKHTVVDKDENSG